MVNGDEQSGPEEVEALVEQFIERDMVDPKTEDEVEELLDEGMAAAALDLIVND
jgi:hypothetical protein